MTETGLFDGVGCSTVIYSSSITWTETQTMSTFTSATDNTTSIGAEHNTVDTRHPEHGESDKVTKTYK